MAERYFRKIRSGPRLWHIRKPDTVLKVHGYSVNYNNNTVTFTNSEVLFFTSLCERDSGNMNVKNAILKIEERIIEPSRLDTCPLCYKLDQKNRLQQGLE